MKKFVSTLSGKIVVVLAFLLIVSVPVYFLLRKKEIKREFITSVYVAANDSADSKIDIPGHMNLKIPKGVMKSADTLEVFSVANIDKPEFSSKVVKTYDLKFKKTNSFKDNITVEFSYDNILKETKGADPKDLALFYYNEKLSKWEPAYVINDKDNRKFVLLAKHFSGYGFVLLDKSIRYHPMMVVPYLTKFPAEIKNVPDMERSAGIIESYSKTGSPSGEAVTAAVGIIEEAYGISSTVSSLAQVVADLPIAKKFDELTGMLGVIFSYKEYAVKLFNGKYDELKIDVLKKFMEFSLEKWGTEAMSIASVGIFMIDYALTSLGEKSVEVKNQNYINAYNNYNSNANHFRKTDKQWVDFAVGLILAGGDLKSGLDREIDNYVKDAWNDDAVSIIIPASEREALMTAERQRVVRVIKDGMNQINEKIYDAKLKESANKLEEIKNLLNKESKVYVTVVGEESEIKNLSVRVVVEEDQKLWSGKTNDLGLWNMPFTYYGYLAYKKPRSAQLVYDGKVLTAPLELNERGAYAKFILPKKEGKNKDELDPAIVGTYEGKIYGSALDGSAPFNGPIKTVINEKFEAVCTGSFSGTQTSKGCTQTYVDDFNMKGNVKKINDTLFVKVEGTKTRNIDVSCQGSSNHLGPSSGQFFLTFKFENSKMILAVQLNELKVEMRKTK